MNLPPVVSAQEWEAARQELLVKEKVTPPITCTPPTAMTSACR